ncbi:pentatricopeptide repeat-containing protein At2g13600-like [Cryptomeria japonica]|uniref:pentatricopeptide repeat-containing protein At2g13600-like n=1 Tax=Cryptomeria japonica TaxID=3369 RepID=UPI0027DA8BAD|nr:pentatricopeptide repeat-containing protein At2g13600-like [Cryptomeria japonica]
MAHHSMSSIANLNLKLRELCNAGRLKEALHLLLTTHNSVIHSSTYLHLLQACIDKKALSEGKQIHSLINARETTFATNPFLQNTLINMYDKCGSVVDAREVFDNMIQPDVFSWNVIIAAYRRHGFPEQALKLFHQMQRTTIQPDNFTFSTILPVCANVASLRHGLQIHGRILRCGFQFNIIVMNTLIDMHVKCGRMHKAVELFDKMSQRDLFSWTAIVAGYTHSRLAEIAFEIFKQMQLAGVKPNSPTFASILPSCAKLAALEQGMEIHQKVMESGFLSDVVATALIDMYAKCGSILKARVLFDKMPKRDVVSWTAIISGYAQYGFVDKALGFFKQMQLAGVKPNSATFASILPACAQTGYLEQGMKIHKKIIEIGLLSDVVVVNALIDMYSKCGIVQKARELFEKMRVKPISATFASILPACAKMRSLEQGMEIHQKIIESGFLSATVVMTALVDMYAKCGSIEKACELFGRIHHPNVTSWNAMITGYVENGALDEASRIFKEMPQRDVASWNAIITGYAQNRLADKALEIFKQMQLEGIKPNSGTITSILTACGRIGALEQSLEIHQKLIQSGFLSDVVIVTALIDVYAKCGSIQKARELFDNIHHPDLASWTAMIKGYALNGVLDEALMLFKEMPQRDVVSWNAIIAGCLQNGFFDEALEIFRNMQLAGVKPDSSTFARILPACSKLGALEQGMEIHQKIIETGLLPDAFGTALIKMYAKCGIIQKARRLFNKIGQPGVFSWNAIIAGYAMHGYSEDAIELFELMKHTGINPNHLSFVFVLFACSHAGLVDDGCKYFNHMTESYCIMHRMYHYVCTVDLLSRAGYLEEALNFVFKMPIIPDMVVWMCLLGGCRLYKDIGIGEFVAKLLLELDPENAAPYVLLSNIYAEAGRWGDAQKINPTSTGDLCNGGKLFLECEGSRELGQYQEIRNEET